MNPFRSLPMAGLALAAMLGLATAAPAATVFTARLGADQEVPPGTSPGSGSGRFRLLGDAMSGFRLSIDLLFSPEFAFPGGPEGGSEIVRGLHIHTAPRGVNGPVIYGMLMPLSDKTPGDVVFETLGSGWTRVTALWEAGDGMPGNPDSILDFAAAVLPLGPGADTPYYVNLHTEAWPAGAIRGQIVAAIPLPAGGLLLLGGLGALALLRRRR
jgi:hypothetical protein